MPQMSRLDTHYATLLITDDDRRKWWSSERLVSDASETLGWDCVELGDAQRHFVWVTSGGQRLRRWVSASHEEGLLGLAVGRGLRPIGMDLCSVRRYDSLLSALPLVLTQSEWGLLSGLLASPVEAARVWACVEAVVKLFRARLFQPATRPQITSACPLSVSGALVEEFDVNSHIVGVLALSSIDESERFEWAAERTR